MTRKAAEPSRRQPGPRRDKEPLHCIAACGREVDIGTCVIRWDQPGSLVCPNPRGRSACTRHDPRLNDAPTLPFSRYRIHNPDQAYEELKKTVHQFVLHYDVCWTSRHCHQLLADSPFKGSHFYLDLDGTVYQTCDLYWKTNTAPADDGLGNERAVHVEMANLSWQARAEESGLHLLQADAYRKTGAGWLLNLPAGRRQELRLQNFRPLAARAYGNRGYFSRKINGRTVRMWDFTEAQYAALIRLCRGVHELLPRVRLQVPWDPEQRRTPLDRLPGFSRFEGILGHAHVQGGNKNKGIKRKYDPGSAFDWGRLRRALSR